MSASSLRIIRFTVRRRRDQATLRYRQTRPSLPRLDQDYRPAHRTSHQPFAVLIPFRNSLTVDDLRPCQGNSPARPDKVADNGRARSDSDQSALAHSFLAGYVYGRTDKFLHKPGRLCELRCRLRQQKPNGRLIAMTGMMLLPAPPKTPLAARERCA
jgi:hypothetical protein